MTHGVSGADIAMIGMAGRFPGAPDVETFWRNLCEGQEAVKFFQPEELGALGLETSRLQDPDFVRASSFLDDVEWFDASFFNVSPREAELMDPQHRVFLECAWEAMERAGYGDEITKGSVGVYGGTTINTYLLCNLMQAPELESLDLVQLNMGNSPDFLTTRVSYKLNLRGPSQAIQSACSTSLVAVHYACQSILHGECDMALAGGVSVNLKLRYGYKYLERGMASPDGHCRAFDKKAQGTIFGSGVGIVVLKRAVAALRDGDHIYAVIKGSAINNDGSMKVGYTAPSVNGQAAVIREALVNAGVEPQTIGYIEAHGTGTALGDPIEIQALSKVFRDCNRKGACGIGSVKTNIGHLDAAAGVAGLIKAALALKNKRIPATLHFESANPEIDFEATPFYVVSKLAEWKEPHGARRAGVSAFGAGGTNAHIVLEEAPETKSEPSSRPWQLLMFSARSEAALQKSTENLAAYLKQEHEGALADVAFTLQVGRRRFPYRRFAVCSSFQEGCEALQALDPQRVYTAYKEPQDRPVAFLFPGQGSQYVGMGSGLYRHEPIFRAIVDQCAEALKPELGMNLQDVLFPDAARREESTGLLTQTWMTQPALFVVEYALARLLLSFGLRLESMIGHSIGEYVAACLAEVLNLDEALRLVTIRGRLMQSLPRGAMLAAGVSESEAEALVDRQISLAAVNGPAQCVFSGEKEAIAELERQLQDDGVMCKRLLTSHAFHSHMVEPVLKTFVEEVRKVKLSPPRIPYLSNVTGQWIKAEEATSPEYWAQHLRGTVRFSQGIKKLLENENCILVEAGPGRALTQAAKRHTRASLEHTLFTTLTELELDHAGVVLGQLWLGGAAIRWQTFYQQERRRRVVLPTYPFERQRYWIEPKKSVPSVRSAQSAELDRLHAAVENSFSQNSSLPVSERLHPRPELKTKYIPPATQLEKDVATICTRVLGVAEIGMDDIFFELGGDSLMALQVVDGLKKELGIDVPVATLYEKLTIRSLTVIFQPDANGADDLGDAEEFRQDRATRRKHYHQRERSKKVV